MCIFNIKFLFYFIFGFASPSFNSYVNFQSGISCLFFTDLSCIFFQVFLVAIALVIDFHLALWYLGVFFGKYLFHVFCYSMSTGENLLTY